MIMLASEAKNYDAAARKFLQENPTVARFIVAAGVAVIATLIADDLTLVGIADDVAIPPILLAMWRVQRPCERTTDMSIDLHIDELVLHGPVTNHLAVAAALEQTLAQSLRHCDPATLTAANVSDLGVLTVGIPPIHL